MIPFREWYEFYSATLEALDATDFTTAAQWGIGHYGYCSLGHQEELPGGVGCLNRWDALFKPKDSAFSTASADHIFAYAACLNLCVAQNDWGGGSLTSFKLRLGQVNDVVHAVDVWEPALVSGRMYDGANNWSGFPVDGYWPYPVPTITVASLPASIVTEKSCYELGVGWGAHHGQPGMFRNGFHIYLESFVPGRLPGDVFRAGCRIEYLRCYMVNCVVNSLSRVWVHEAGGDTLVLAGLGFDNTDAEVAAIGPGDVPGGGFLDAVDFIYLEGLQGQGTYTLQRTLGHFTIDSNSQITIAATPAMIRGTYAVRLQKVGVNCDGVVPTVNSYAGDFWCTSDGRMYAGARMALQVGEPLTRRRPITLTRWRFRKRDGTYITKYYAPIDTCAPDVFYDGRILSIGSLDRGMDDLTGMPNIAEMTVEMANTDKEFSKLLDEYVLKNAECEVWLAWAEEPHGLKVAQTRLVVDDYSRKGTAFNFILRDVSTQYFKVQVPRYFVTKVEYPNAHEQALGQPMPEVLGYNVHDTGDAPGAVTALYVDITTFTYLAARGSLHAVLAVYSDGVLVGGGSYEVFYDVQGRTLIQFAGDQGSNKITFNAEGYMFEPWNSANDYVQNPIYILLFYLALIAEIPIEFFRLDKFIDLAAIYDTLGWGEAGRWAAASFQGADSGLQELLFSFGCKLYQEKSGQFVVGKKDISSFANSMRLFDQIDALEPAGQAFSLRSAVNSLRVLADLQLAPGLCKLAKQQQRQSSIDDLQAVIEPGTSPTVFPWITLESMLDQLMQDYLLKYGYGDQKLTFPVGIHYIDELEIFGNFRFQDLFGLDKLGVGQPGRYYYIERMSTDLLGGAITITAIDFQWLLRQYFILGDEGALAATWAAASDTDRMYGYLCNEVTGKFADGEPGKILVDENVLGSGT